MSNSITLTAINTRVDLPVIYRNTSCELKIILTNETGGEISMQPDKSCIYVEIPGITGDEIAAANVTLDGWITQIDDTCIQLIYVGEDGVKWPNDQKRIITICNLTTAAQPAKVDIQVNIAGFIPKPKSSQLFTPIVISNPAKPGNAKLEEVLQLSFDTQGVIYISPQSDPGIQKLQNELLLNIKNTGSVPLYTGKEKIEPRIEASFIYGNTIGCLTPASEEEGGEYAWDIFATIPYKPAAYSWRAEQPSRSSGASRPQWVFKPESTNSGLIGTGADANVTFSFSKIIATTPVGHTEILLRFSGFMKDDTTAYDDALFILDIVKEAPPLTSGVIYFYGMESNIDVYNPFTPGELEFRWLLFNVAEIKIEFSNPTETKSKKYYSSTPLTNDQMRIPLGHVTQETIIATLTAYRATGAVLNEKQFIIAVRKCFFTDSRGDVQYPGIHLGNRLWMTQNLADNNEQSKKNKFGCLYSWEGAKLPLCPDGWRLPRSDDWEDLLASCPPTETPYAWLIKGGKSGFNAVLGGFTRKGVPGNRQEDIEGRYWINKEDGLSNAETISFDSVHSNVTFGDEVKLPKDSYVAVRYVKDFKKK